MSTQTAKNQRLSDPILGIFEDEYSEGHFYQYIGYAPDDESKIILKDLETGNEVSKRKLELYSSNGKPGHCTLTGKNIEEVKNKRHSLLKNQDPINYESLPKKAILKAKNIVFIVNYVEEEYKKRKSKKGADGKRILKDDLIEIILDEFRVNTGQINTFLVENKVNEEDNFKFKVPKRTQYYAHYLRKYNEFNGNINLIANSFRSKSFNLGRLDNAIVALVDLLISMFWRTDNPPFKVDVYRELKSLLTNITQFRWFTQPSTELDSEILRKIVAQEINIDDAINLFKNPVTLKNVEMPSPSWLYGRLRWYEHDPEIGSDYLEKMVGKDFWERNFLVFDHFLKIAQYCLQYVFADHYRLDINVSDGKGGKKVLWVTMLIDVYSRAILGYFISENYPSIWSIQMALKNSIFLKNIPDVLKEKHGDWICCGIPLKLFLDNAWSHLSSSLITFCSIISQKGVFHSIDLFWRPPYKARYGGIIESLFSGFAKKFRSMLVSAIQNSPEKRRAFDEGNICLLEEDVHLIVLKMVLDYMHTPHTSLEGKTPHQKWIEGTQARPDESLSIPNYTPEIERQFWWMYPKTKTFTSQGFGIFGVHYVNKKLHEIPRKDKNGRKILFDIRYNPEDVSHIAIFTHGTGKWLGDVYNPKLIMANGETLRRSLAEQLAINSLSRERREEYYKSADTRREAGKLEKKRLIERQEYSKAQAKEEARKAKAAANTTPESESGFDMNAMQKAFEKSLKKTSSNQSNS